MAPPAIWRPTSAIRTLAFGMYTSWRSRPVASIGEANAGAIPFSAQSADNWSMSVMRACLTRYSTRTDEPRNERAIALPRLTKLETVACWGAGRSRGGERNSARQPRQIDWWPRDCVRLAAIHYTPSAESRSTDERWRY